MRKIFYTVNELHIIMTSIETETYTTLKPTLFKRADLSKLEERTGGDISSVFSSLGDGDCSSENQYPPRYIELKKNLIKDPDAVQSSWIRLKKRLSERIKEVSEQGSNFIPSINFSDLDSLSKDEASKILDRGALVIRGVIPRDEARSLKTDADEYIKNNPQTVGFPKGKEVVYELYWSKTQIKARSDERMRKCFKFTNNLWTASDDSLISLDQNISYADRFRIRNAGDSLFSLGPHADGGGIERWEDENYSLCYSDILEGNWEKYNPYDATQRVNANLSLYPTGGACNVFRTFQGWLAMSDIAPNEGTILFAPLVREVTAYYILRPFFNKDDELDLQNANFPGTVIGKTQEFNNRTHPDLELSKLMTPVPKVQPGDAVFWHCDLIHAVDPKHEGKSDSSVIYIPSVPLCDLNVRYAHIQREAFLNGLVAPDFPGFPSSQGETTHIGRADGKFVDETVDEGGLQELCLRPFDIKKEHTSGAKIATTQANHLLFDF